MDDVHAAGEEISVLLAPGEKAAGEGLWVCLAPPLAFIEQGWTDSAFRLQDL